MKNKILEFLKIKNKKPKQALINITPDKVEQVTVLLKIYNDLRNCSESNELPTFDMCLDNLAYFNVFVKDNNDILNYATFLEEADPALVASELIARFIHDSIVASGGEIRH